MTINLSILKPLAVTNLVTNPSLELNTTGWNAMAGAIAQSSVRAAMGAYSLGVTPAAGVNDGTYFATVTLVNGTQYTFSAYVWGVATIPYKIYFADTSAVLLGSAVTFTGKGAWVRVQVTWTENVGAARRLYITKNNNASVGVYYIDAAVCEATAVASSYVDGDQPGCRWTGASHGSTSTRDAQSREGGSIETIYASPIPNSNYFTGLPKPGLSGIGMPQPNNIGIPLSQQHGEQYQRTLYLPRILSIYGAIDGSQLDDLHTRRQNLIDLMKAELVFPQQPFWLRYYNDDALTGGFSSTSAGKAVRIKGLYLSGLEFQSLMGLTMDNPLRIECKNPLWYEELDSALVLGYSSTIANANYILQRDTTGAWGALGTGMNGIMQALVYDKNSNLYAGGQFGAAGGVGSTAKVAMWNGSVWVPLGAGANDNFVLSLAMGPDGTTLYAGGSFTAMNSVSNTPRIARWDGAAWNAMGTGGASGGVYALCLDKSGNVYAGGTFSGMGGVSNTLRIARWDGAAWNAMSTGADGQVNALVADVSGNIYAGGAFANMGGVACAGIAKWNGTTWANIGNVTGGGATVYALARGKDGTLYAGGDFTSIGGISANNIAKWNGTAWTPLGTGTSSIVYSIAVHPDGSVIVGGHFATAGGVTCPDSVARWNGTTWHPLDVVLPSSPAQINALAIAGDSAFAPSLTLGYTTNGSATGATVAAGQASNGSAESAPKIYLTGPGTVVQIANRTTGKLIQFNGLVLLAGETATIDLTPDNQSFVSSFRGNLMNYLLAANQLATWRLAPGANNISVLITGGSGATKAVMVWRAAHLSADAVL